MQAWTGTQHVPVHPGFVRSFSRIQGGRSVHRYGKRARWHYRFEAIHPFADGNGRTGRALALWELYRRGFDTHHIFSVDEFYWENRPRYYASLQAVRQHGEDLTSWLEYASEGLLITLERVWTRVQKLSARAGQKQFVLRSEERRVGKEC